MHELKPSHTIMFMTIWLAMVVLFIGNHFENERKTETTEETILVLAALIRSHNLHQQAIAENKESIKILTDMSCWPWPNETERGSVDENDIQPPAQDETIPE